MKIFLTFFTMALLLVGVKADPKVDAKVVQMQVIDNGNGHRLTVIVLLEDGRIYKKDIENYLSLEWTAVK